MGSATKCPTCGRAMFWQHRIADAPELVCLTCRRAKKHPQLTHSAPEPTPDGEIPAKPSQ